VYPIISMSQKKINLFYCFKKAGYSTLVIFAIIFQFANPIIVFAETEPRPNPIFSKNCGLDVVLVLDNSTSISEADIQKEKAAFLGLIDDLSGTPSEFSVLNFGTRAQPKIGFGGSISEVKNAINNILYDGYAATNWQDALIVSKNFLPNRNNKSNLIIFASDGNPTINNDDLSVFDLPINGNDWSYLDNNDRENAIIAANDVKQIYNTRIVTLGIGDAVNEGNLRKISGNLAGDHYNVDNFDELKTALHDLAAGMCGGTITATKKIGVEGNWVPAGGWSFNIGGQSKITDAINGQTEAVELVNGDDYAVVETPQADYSLFDASCSISNGGGAVGVFDSANNKVTGIAVDTQDIIACTFYNKVQCQKIFGPESCFKEGWAKKDYSWNFPQFCEAAGADEYEKHPDCDCVESSSKSCTGPRTSLTSYTYNFSYCPAKDDLVNDDDAECDSEWTCGDWTDAECVSNDGGGKRKQTQSCTDQYGGAKTNERIVGDLTCGCAQTETGRNCFADGMARVEYSLGGQSYCSGTFTAEESDAACACRYSTWANSGCAGDGKMGQGRNNETTAFTYCVDLTRQIDDVSCAQCTAWSDWGTCSATCDGGITIRTCTAGGLVGNTESAECNTQSCGGSQMTYHWSDWGTCSATCGGGTQTRTCLDEQNNAVDDSFCSGAATQICNAQSCGSSEGGSSGGGISGDYNKNYFDNPVGGQVAGAAIDLDEIQRQINEIRDKVNDIANQINNLPKGILGATDVATGVLPVIADMNGISIAALPAQSEFTLPEPTAAISPNPKQ